MASERENIAEWSAHHVLVVGGGSRAAQAFRRHVSVTGPFKITTLVRRPLNAYPGESVVQVEDYFGPPEDVFRGVDAVINFVGLVRGQDKARLHAVNVAGPIRLAASAKRLGVIHFVHLSSFQVYGYAEDISSATPVSPNTPYAHSKLTADIELLRLADGTFVVTLLRVPILYGKGIGENLTKLASLMKRARLFPVASRPLLRSGLHIDNLAVLLEAVIGDRSGGIRFGADPEPFTLELLADAVTDVTGRRPFLIRLPDVAFLPLRVFSKGLHSRLYRQSLVRQGDCVRPACDFPVAVRIGLRDVVPK